MELHNTVIKYNEIDAKFPRRNLFIDKNLYPEVNDKIKSGNLVFLPNSVHDKTRMQKSKYDKSKYKITMFGIAEDGRPMCVIIDDILLYFEVRIPKEKEDDRSDFALQIVQEINMGSDDYKRYADTVGTSRDATKYWKIEPVDYDIVKGKPFKYFQEEDSYYVRIFFNKDNYRSDAIKYVRAKGYETAHDDINNYYRVFCRDNLLSYASWLELSNITYTSNHKYIKGDVIHVSAKPTNGEPNIRVLNMSKYNGSIPKHIQKDNSLVMTWDIETYNPVGFEVPTYNHPEHKCYMICMTFQLVHSNEQLLRVCLIDKPSAPHEDFLTIICASEKELFRAFAKCTGMMLPEIILGFNDAGYDWPWIVERAKKYPGLLAYIGEKLDRTWHIGTGNRKDADTLRKYTSFSVKIEASVNAQGRNLQMPGYIPVDVMIEFRKLYPTSEKWGLNFFLSKNKLSLKEDLSYKEQKNIYSNLVDHENNNKEFSPALLKKASLIGKYCIIDAQKCHELMKIRNVIQDRREVANISFTSLYDAFYYANGMKVRNLVIARAQLRNLKISNISNTEIEQGKYPGAWVFPPIKGLQISKLSIRERIEKAKRGFKEYDAWLEKTDEEIQKDLEFIEKHGCFITPEHKDYSSLKNDNPSLCKFLEEKTGRPITGLDFASLYPSLIMAYNLSPECIIIDKNYAKLINSKTDEIGNKMYNLHRISFIFNGRNIRGWSIRHDNKLDPSKPDYRFGIFGAILKELFDARKKLKKSENGLEYWEHRKEDLLSLPPEEFRLPHIQEEYENVCFNFNSLDSKQKALKVFMNTFYGEAGNKLSPLFMLQVAGGVTSSGQDNIKLAYLFVEKEGCKVYYGDTDSLYLSVPEDKFTKLDIEYYTEKISKLEYWEQQVKITFAEIKKINAGINAALVADNGTEFLKMAYEEALYPMALMAKKKYIGLPHLSKPNFDPKVPLFIRGLELKKRGVSTFLKVICEGILKTAMSINNIMTIMELVQEKIREVYTTDWTERFNDFVMTAVYKPDKLNVKVRRFVERMREERGIDITPGERIDYVIVKKHPVTYDVRGRKSKLKVGDMMELADIAKKDKLEINIDHYMKNSINGQLARFITYHENFYVSVKDYSDNSEIKKAEDSILRKARKFIDNYSLPYYTQYKDLGVQYKQIFKQASSAVNFILEVLCKNKQVLTILKNSVGNTKDCVITDWIYKKIVSRIESVARNKTFGKDYVNHRLKGLSGKAKKDALCKMQEVFYGEGRVLQKCEQAFNERRQILDLFMKKSLSRMNWLFTTNEVIIQTLVKEIKEDEDNIMDMETTKLLALSILEDNDVELQAAITELEELYTHIMSTHFYIFKVRKIVEYLREFKVTRVVPKYISENLESIISETSREYLSELHY